MCHVTKYSVICGVFCSSVWSDAAVRKFEYVESPWLPYELTHRLRTLYYYRHPFSTNITRKNYLIIFLKVVVQFCVAGRTDPGNKVGSWGRWTKAP